MFLTIIIIFAVVAGCDLYISISFLRSWPLVARLLWWAPAVVLAVCSVLMARGHWSGVVDVLLFVLLCLSLPKVVFTLFSLLGRLAGLCCHGAPLWLNVAGIVAGAMVMAGALYGFCYGWRHLVVRQVTVRSESLPAAFDGYRIAQISDLHLGTFAGNEAYIDTLVCRINALKPDMIVFTGDLVNFHPDEILPFDTILSRLHAPDGVLSVLGNHDYSLYAPVAHSSRQALVDRTIALERSLGWRLLLDENVAVTRGGDTLYVAGVQNIGRRFSANKGNLDKAMAGIPDGAYTVLLSHDPTHFDDSVAGKTRIPLTLSGHTHAMQLKLMGWSPSSMIFDHWGGLYRVGDQYLNVSTGAGGNMRFRYGAWPEIVLITLKK